MKNLLYIMAVVAAVLFTACDELDHAIADQGDRIDQLEQLSIKGIEDQVAAINASMSDLEAVDKELDGYIKALEAKVAGYEKQIADLEKQVADGNSAAEAKHAELEKEIKTLKALIEDLKAKDAELDKKIEDIKKYVEEDLKKYIDDEIKDTEEWAKVTFATLEQYSELQKEVSAISALVEKQKTELTEDIETAVKALEKSMQEWVNKTLSEGYYDIAAIDAKLEAIQKQIADAIKAREDADDALAAADEALAKQIEAQQAALDQAKKDIAAAYEKAIADAIETNNGVITEAYTKAIADAVKGLETTIGEINKAIEDIEDRLDVLEGDVEDLEGEVAALKNRIQSIRFIPEYSDGKVELLDATSLDFMLAPKAAAGEVTKDHVTAFISRTKTRAADDPTALEVASVTGDAATGILNVVVSAAGLPQDFWGETPDANIFICISDGNNDIISEMIPIVSMERLDTEEELVAALETGEVKIEDDITLTGPITIPAAVTKSSGTNEVVIDLNGHVLSYTSTVQGEAMITNKGNLTIKDSKTGGKLSFTYAGEPDTSYGKGNYTISNCGALTIESGIIENNTAKMSHASYAIDNNSTIGNTILTINGGKVINHQSVAIRQFCNGNENTVNINNGEIEGSRAIWTQLPGNNINTAPIVNLTIKGGVLTSLGETSGGYDYKMAIYSYTFGNSVQNVKYKIDGGTFNGDIALLGSSDNASQTVEITGGTFNGFDGCLYSWGDDTAAAEAIKITGGTFSDVYPLTYVGNGESTTVKLVEDCTLGEGEKIAINKGATVTLDLNGKSLSGKDNTEKSFGLINNTGTLTVKNGNITLSATINSGWGRYSSVISNNPGGTLTIEKGATIEHLGGTDMAYGIDNLTNGKGTYAVTTIKGGTVKSTYSAIRQFLNGIEATNELYVMDGSTLISPNRAVFFQDPSKNPNTGKLNIEAGASVSGKVHLSVTEGSTEWPVEVSIASPNTVVTYSNVPEGYVVEQIDGVWTVRKTE